MNTRRLLFFVAALLGPLVLHAEGLRIGLMPAVDSLPFIVADQQGYFREAGVVVELVMFQNQVYRETALQTGAVDGSVSDLVNALGARDRGFPIRVTSSTDGRFALVASPRSPARTLEAWRTGSGRLRTGLLENSMIYYLTERMLENAGADPGRVELVTSPDVPLRLEMLLAGRLDSACLPEPITRLAVAGGATVVVESTSLPEMPGVLLFTESALGGKAAEIRAMYRAYDRAVEFLATGGADLGTTARETIVRQGGLPPAAAEAMLLPDYAPAHLPSRELVADVAAWMRLHGLLKGAVSYENLTDAGALR